MLAPHIPIIGGGAPDPVVITSAGYTSNNFPAVTHNLTLPGGITAGDLLLLFSGNSGNSTFGVPSGWNLLGSVEEGAANTDRGIDVIWKTASGSESASVTVNIGTSNNCTSLCYLIRRNKFNPQIATGTIGVSAAPNSGNLVPTWGATRNTLWFTAMNHRNTAAASAAPSGYADLETRVANNLSLAVARKQVRAASDDPGAFNVGGVSDSWAAFTVGVG